MPLFHLASGFNQSAGFCEQAATWQPVQQVSEHSFSQPGYINLDRVTATRKRDVKQAAIEDRFDEGGEPLTGSFGVASDESGEQLNRASVIFGKFFAHVLRQFALQSSESTGDQSSRVSHFHRGGDDSFHQAVAKNSAAIVDSHGIFVGASRFDFVGSDIAKQFEQSDSVGNRSASPCGQRFDLLLSALGGGRVGWIGRLRRGVNFGECDVGTNRPHASQRLQEVETAGQSFHFGFEFIDTAAVAAGVKDRTFVSVIGRVAIADVFIRRIKKSRLFIFFW